MWDEKRAQNAEARGKELADGEDEEGENPEAEASAPPAPPAKLPDDLAAGPHPLESGWALWEHRAADGTNRGSYEENMNKLVEFATIEDFWHCWNNIPKPSDIFFDGNSHKKVGERMIESLSVFKAGIKPEWEDKANRAGAELFIRHKFKMPDLDEIWQKLVLCMIGETLDKGDEITGARVVDKSVRGKPMYRLELWFRTKDAMDTLKGALVEHINDPKKPLMWDMRPHS